MFEKPEVKTRLDEALSGTQPLTTLAWHKLPMLQLACTSDGPTHDMIAVPPLHSRPQVYDKLT